VSSEPDKTLLKLPPQPESALTSWPEVKEWNETATDYPKDSCVHELFEQQAAERPGAIAVAEGVEQLSYAELNHRANQLGHYLRQRGVGPETLVGIAIERSVPMIVAMLGVLKAGGAYLPLDSSYPPERLRFMLGDARPEALITDSVHKGAFESAGVPLICLDADGQEIGRESEGNPPRQNTAEGLAYVMYTSGSTGNPKGVQILHRGIVRLVINTNYIEFTPDDVVAQISNALFDAITFEVWGALLNGARLEILPADVVLSPERFAATIERQGISTMFLTAALFKLMAAMTPAAFGSLTNLVVGGDAVDPESARNILSTAPPRRLVNGYGPTEATTFSVCHLIEDVPAGATSIPIGRPISNSQAYILNSAREPVPVGVPGELCLGGDGLARGYLNRPELNAERFIPNPFDADPGSRLYCTGDRARFRSGGTIEFLGRTDHQVKLRGFRIELGEIEGVLRQHPAVQDCVAVVADESLVVYAVTRGESRPSSWELRQFLRAKLPGYMAPGTVVTLDALPLTPSGKLDRKALPAPPRTVGQQNESATALQSWLSSVWQSVCGIGEPGLDDNFFDLGGSSLELARVEAEIRTRIESDICITDLFANPTIRTLSSRLEQGTKPAAQLRQTQDRARRQSEAFGKLRAREAGRG
jgi:amino acid adenylation domain-containing protein